MGRAREGDKEAAMDLDRFGVATFNLYNLQLPGEAMNPRQRPWTPEEYSRKVRWAGDRLRELQADVVGLQELWHADAMREVLERANLDDDYDLLADAGHGRAHRLRRPGAQRAAARRSGVDRRLPPGHAAPSRRRRTRRLRTSRSASTASPARCWPSTSRCGRRPR